ncbi:MAG: hypothetical protein NTV21_02950 [Planctomycetota bacterium]|nr:hypothetical protein [Planctomycetota bacterium]
MISKDSIWNKISAPMVLLVLGAVFTGLFIAPSFESARPRSLSLGYDPVRSAGRANGLITFDPLEQAYGEVEQLYKEKGSKTGPWLDEGGRTSSRYSLEMLARGLADGVGLEAPAEGGERLLVLLESLRGGALSEDHERRLRGRYATVAALARERIYPAHSKRLNLLWFDDPTTDPLTPDRTFADPPSRGVLVPYEYLERGAGSDSPYRRVVVCWVDEAAIERNPLEFGVQFERRVREEVASVTNASVGERLDVRWIGPTTSGGLKALMRGLDVPSPERDATRLKVVTPYATSPLVRLPQDAGWNEPGLSLRRSVHTDDVLARLLVNELLVRVPALMPLHHPKDTARDDASPTWTRALAAPLRLVGFVPPPKDGQPVRVALITELDSTYGQAWLQNMERARDELASNQGESGAHPQLKNLQFTVFPVFGWVDGVVREPSDKRDSSAATSVARDYPAEAHQLDYLSRLRDDLQAGGEFCAVAIFVTEEYDTMLILESLRPKFPGAMFLTTDLDARYLQPRHAPFTRNLIVASHFGLTPQAGPDDTKPDEDGALRVAPEFRDGYQTAVWHTVRALANNVEPRPPATDGIYEIGRSRFVALNAEAGPQPGELLHKLPERHIAARATPLARVATSVEELFAPSSVEAAAAGAAKEPAARSGPPLGIYVWSLGSAALLLLGLLVFSTRTGRKSGSRGRADSKTLLKFGVICGLALAFGIAAVAVELVQRNYPAEPLAWLEGVSAWPTIALRVLTTLVSLSALVMIPLRLRRAEQQLATRHGIVAGAKPVRAAWVLDWSFINEASGPVSAPKPASRLARAWNVLRRSGAGVLSALRFLMGARGAPNVTAEPLERVWAFVRQSVARPWSTWARMLLLAMALYFCLAPFFILAGPTSNPARGEFAYLLERITLFTSVFSFLMLMMLVMETTFFASRLVSQIVDPAAVSLHRQIADLAVDRRERLELAQDLARVVDPLVWSPMVVLGLMIASRASVFDAWPWPIVLVGVFSLFLVMLLMCVVSLRRQCEQARVLALADIGALSDSEELTEPVRKQLASIRTEIEALAGGAFSPLIQHPIVRALSLPLTAFGANLAFERNLLERFLGAF